MSSRAKVYVGLDESVREILFDADTWARLEKLADVDVLGAGRLLPQRLCDDYDVLVSGWGTPLLEAVDGDRLGLVVQSAGSWRSAVTEAVLAAVPVAQAGSDPMARAVAEFALTMQLSILRHLHTYDRGMQSTHDWVASRHPEYGTAIHAVRHGLIGLSRVGVWHARMLRGLGCEDIVAFDPYWNDDAASMLGVRLVSLEEAMSSQAVSVHAPVTPETRGMLGERELALIPDGGVLINTARSAVINTAALERELLSGRIRAGLDVFDEEPLPSSSPLFGLPNVLLAPHVAGATREARYEQGRTVVDEIERHLGGEPLRFAVDPGVAARLS